MNGSSAHEGLAMGFPKAEIGVEGSSWGLYIRRYRPLSPIHYRLPCHPAHYHLRKEL